MRVLYWTPRRKPELEEREAGLTYVPLDQLLAESDFVSMHAPLTESTTRPEIRPCVVCAKDWVMAQRTIHTRFLPIPSS